MENHEPQLKLSFARQAKCQQRVSDRRERSHKLSFMNLRNVHLQTTSKSTKVVLFICVVFLCVASLTFQVRYISNSQDLIQDRRHYPTVVTRDASKSSYRKNAVIGEHNQKGVGNSFEKANDLSPSLLSTTNLPLDESPNGEFEKVDARSKASKIFSDSVDADMIHMEVNQEILNAVNLRGEKTKSREFKKPGVGQEVYQGSDAKRKSISDFLDAGLAKSLELDISTIQRQTNLFPEMAMVVILRTENASDRVLHNIKNISMAMLRLGGSLQVVYFGSHPEDVIRLRFAAQATLSAVHCLSPKELKKSVLSINPIAFEPWTRLKRNEEKNLIWAEQRHLLEIVLYMRLVEYMDLQHIWVLDWDVQYYGNLDRLLDGIQKSSQQIDYLYVPSSETSSIAVQGLKRLSPRLIVELMPTVFASNEMENVEGLIQVVCSSMDSCRMEPLVQFLDDGSVGLKLQSQKAGSGAISEFIACSELYTSNYNDTYKIGSGLADLGCNTLQGEFVRSQLRFEMRENLLHDVALSNRFRNETCKQFLYDLQNYNYTKPKRDGRFGTDIQLEKGKVYNGKNTDWWAFTQQRAAPAFQFWDLDMIKRQYRATPNPKTLFIFRTHLVSNRILQSLMSIGQALMRYGGHLHVIFQGEICEAETVESLRQVLAGVLGAVHWMRHESVRSIIYHSKDAAEIAKKCNSSRTCNRSFRHSGVLWLFAYVPEVLFLAAYGPLPDDAYIWCMEYDVVFNGDITNLFESARKVDADVLMPAAGPGKGGFYNKDIKNSRQWPWWDFIGKWAPRPKQFRALASTKRLKANFAANVINALFFKHYWAADELFYGSVCVNLNSVPLPTNSTGDGARPACVPKIINDQPELANIFETTMYQFLPVGDESTLVNASFSNLLLHKIVQLFDVREHQFLDATFILPSPAVVEQ